MIRRLAFALIAALGVLASTPAARAEVNLHNGFIEFVDQIHYTGDPVGIADKSTYHGVKPLTLRLLVKLHAISADYETVLSGGSAFLNPCCILAGSYYLISGRTTETWPNGYVVGDVTPRLCNTRGIPFGYAKIAVVGDVVYNPYTVNAHTAHAYNVDSYRITSLRFVRVDEGCPSL